MTHVYDGTIPTIISTVTITGVSSATNIVPTGTIGSNAGDYVLTYTATDLISNKQIRKTATITITKKPITITANVATKVYGTANPSFTYTTTGLVQSDTLSGTLGSSGLSNGNVGSYDITNTLSNDNYAISFDGVGKFSISKKPITITANAVSKLQGSAINPTLSHDGANKLLGSDTLTGTLGSIGLSTSTAGTYDITSTLSNNNYDITFVGEKKFSIDSKPQINLTSKTLSYVYDGTIPTKPTATAITNSAATITISGNIGKDVGIYPLTYTAIDSLGNVAIPQIATITITPKAVTVTAKVATKVYGDATPIFGYVSVGLVSGDTLAGTLTSSAVNAGTYTISGSLTNTNYDINFDGVNKFIISKKVITITANPATKVYGTANPNFTYASVVGLVGSDSLSGGLSVSVSNNADAGTYDITSTLSNNNYDITFVGDNKFSILKASQPAFSIGNNQDKTFVSSATSGTTFTITTTGTLSTNQATYSTSNANIATIDVNGVITLKAAGTVTIGATSTADANYKDKYSSFILTIYPSTTTLANATATSSGIQLAWSAVVGSSISYKVYYASETIIGYPNLASNYSNLQGGALIDNLTTTATTVFNLKHYVDYYFVVTVVQNNVESPISNEITSTLQIPATGTINDTGVTRGANYLSDSNPTCTSNIASPQDCHQGRDAKAVAGTLAKLGGGSAGFDFTKLDSSGNALTFSASSWSCVRDNYTGMIWEVKTTSGLHNATDTYTWYSTATNANVGTINATGTTCDGYIAASTSTYCNTQAFVARVNSAGLCGANNWQLPNKEQLRSIVNYGYSSANPAIDIDYFPRTAANYFWSSTPYAFKSSQEWRVNFNLGGVDGSNSNNSFRVRLVRPRP